MTLGRDDLNRRAQREACEAAIYEARRRLRTADDIATESDKSYGEPANGASERRTSRTCV
jgi:hypothetical protein